MGAGASTNAKKGAAAEPVSGAAALAKAESSEKEGKKLFKVIDANNDKFVTVKEIQAAIKKHGKDISAKWPPATISETVTFFDRDKDGKLSEKEFLECLAELKKREEAESAPKKETPKENPVAIEAKAKYDTYKDKSEGTFVLKQMAKLIRDINDEEGIWDDSQFGTVVKAELAKASGSDEKKPKLGMDCFLAWYPGFYEGQVKAILDQREKDAAARKAAKAAASKPTFEGDVWSCPMENLIDAYEQAGKAGKTPLLIDCTTPEEAERTASFSPLETFFSYSSEAYIELKKAVVETGFKKEKTVEEVQEEFAKTLLRAMKQGQMLVLLCSNSAPPFTSKFSAPHALPMEVLDAKKVQQVIGPDAKLEESWVQAVTEFADKKNWQTSDVTLLSKMGIVHQNFKTVVVTKFEPDDYAGFLESEWPLDLMQPIKVFTRS